MYFPVVGLEKVLTETLFAGVSPISSHCPTHGETSPLVCNANELTKLDVEKWNVEMYRNGRSRFGANGSFSGLRITLEFNVKPSYLS